MSKLTAKNNAVTIFDEPETATQFSEISRDANGAIVRAKNGTRPSFFEFVRDGYTARVSIGMLGGPEANLSFNMDYSDNVHRFYDPSINAVWTALGANGFYVQFAPAGAAPDVWHNSGKLLFSAEVDRATFYGALRERHRSFDVGERLTPTFNASDFTASTGSWTVSASGVDVSYTLVGKLMTVTVTVTGSTVTGWPSELRMKIPGGYVCAKQATEILKTHDNGARQAGIGYVSAGSDFIRFYSTIPANVNWQATTVEPTAITGTMFFFVE